MNSNGIYLCKPKGDIVALLNVDEDSVQLTESVADLWELSFTIHRYIMNDGLKENPYYESIAEMMELYLNSDNCLARFVIDETPTVSSDGTAETKTVTAHSIEAELQYKKLENFQINTGQKISQENLLKGSLIRDDDTNTGELYNYNINPYTELPVDYITVKCRLGEELQAFRNSIVVNGDSISFQWQYQNDDTPTTVEAEYHPLTGSLTCSQPLLLTDWYTEFTNKFPRIIGDIMWGIDKRDDSPTTDEIVCVTETYLALRYDASGSVLVYIPAEQYVYEESAEQHAYEIYTAPSPIYTFDRFLGGLQQIIDFYDRYGNQLSLLDLALEQARATDWTVGDVPENVAVKKYSFEVDNQDIYSFFTNTMSHTMKVIFDFDRMAKKVNVIDLSLDDKRFETGIITGFQNLLQTVDIQTSSSDGIVTTFTPTGANDLGITYVNFGSEKITNLDYFINKVDKYNDYQYGTQELHDKYRAWKRFRNDDKITLSHIPMYDELLESFININTKTITASDSDITGTRQDVYIELSKRYNRLLKDINELTYLVPSDGTLTDYTTYSLEDLKTVMKAYINAYNSLVEIYKAETGKNEIVESEIAQTYFYQDWKLYYYTIIPNVRNAMRMYALTDDEGNFLDKDGNITEYLDEFVYPDGGNPVYNANADLVIKPKSSLSGKFGKSEEYLYDLSLYGLSELTNVKKKGWVAAAAQIYKPAFVKSGTPGVDAVYRTWAEVLADENLSNGFSGEDAYNRQLNLYLDYMSTESRPNSLTKTDSVGVVVLVNQAITDCENIIAQLNDMLTQIGDARTEIAESVTYEGWGQFTDKELSILYSLSHEADYTNENILTTSLDDIVSTVAVQKELLDDANKRLFEKSRPQYSFATSIDNIFALEEFAPLRSQLKLLNYFYLRYGLYDDETIKLRIVGMSFNPILKSKEFVIEFSNMTYTFEGMNDYYYLFDEKSGGGSSGGGSSSGGSGGTYGANDAEITLSNNMLNALLKNDITAKSLNIENKATPQVIESLIHSGDLVIDGAAVTNVIRSLNYNGTLPSGIDNTEGSILELKNGYFNFGGGNLVFDGSSFHIKGEMVGGVIKSENYNGTDNQLDNTEGSILELTNGYFNFGGGRLTLEHGAREDRLSVNDGTIVGGVVQSKNYDPDPDNPQGSILKLTDGTFDFGGGSLVFKDSETLPPVKKLYIKGEIDATGGKIGGFTIKDTFLTIGKSSYDGDIETETVHPTGVTMSQEDITRSATYSVAPVVDYTYTYASGICAVTITKLKFETGSEDPPVDPIYYDLDIRIRSNDSLDEVWIISKRIKRADCTADTGGYHKYTESKEITEEKTVVKSEDGIYIGTEGLCIGKDNAFAVTETGNVSITKHLEVNTEDSASGITMQNQTAVVSVAPNRVKVQNGSSQVGLSGGSITLSSGYNYSIIMNMSGIHRMVNGRITQTYVSFT